MVQGTATRQGFRSSEEARLLTTKGLGTEPLCHWPEPTAEAPVDIRNAYSVKCHEYLRAHRETYPSALPFIQPDTWRDVEIRGLRTSELRSRVIGQEIPADARLILLWLLSRDPVPYVSHDDPSVWFYCEDPEPTTAPEDEYPEWEWIQANEAWLHEKYAGLWIAVRGNGIVAVAESEVEVLKQADKPGQENAFTFYVPTESEPAVVVVAG